MPGEIGHKDIMGALMWINCYRKPKRFGISFGRPANWLTNRNSGFRYSVVHSHCSRNVEARLSLIEGFPRDTGTSILMP